MRNFMAIGVGLAVATMSTAALAEDAKPAGAAAAAAGPGFGQAGQIAISSDFQLSFTKSTIKPPDPPGGDSTSSTTIRLAPALDYFVAPHISVGAAVGYRSTSTDCGKDTCKSGAILLAPRVGYALDLAEKLTFWPQVGIEYAKTSQDAGGKSTSGNTLALQIFAPIQFHPAQHFFVGLGPVFSMDLQSKVEGENAAKTTTMGVASTVGGYF